MDNNFFRGAVEKVTEAIQADRQGDYPRALDLYKQALERFMVGLKYEKNESTKEIITRKVVGYMERAEVLKKAIDQPEYGHAPQGSSGEVTAVRPAEKDSKTDEDPEEARLRNAVEGAIVSMKPNVKWEDVAGLDAAKDALREAVILPARFPQLFTGNRRPWAGILLYGPPGTGKSYLAKAVATEADATFFSVSSADLVSKWQGESERLVRNLFQLAREKAPSIVFIDEIDSLCSSRSDGENDATRRIKTEFLVQMQGVGKEESGKRVLILGATNVPWDLDSAIRRRLERRIYIPLPEQNARGGMFRIHLGNTPHTITDEEFEVLGERTDGFSGSDISIVVREALMEPLRKCQSARFFRQTRDGMFVPCDPIDEDPPCSACPMRISSRRIEPRQNCSSCGAIAATLFEIPPEKLQPPDVTMTDFLRVLERVNPSVSYSELERFEQWTTEFGEEGT